MTDHHLYAPLRDDEATDLASAPVTAEDTLTFGEIALVIAVGLLIVCAAGAVIFN